MNNVQALPGVFPLHEDRNYLSESEWVIFKLLCRPVDSFAQAMPEELSVATGNQVSVKRCDELIRLVRIHQLPGLGSWIARLLAEAGFSEADVMESSATAIIETLNAKIGYPLCNAATIRALHALQMQWKGANESN
jgi:hypothetical protein